MIKMNMFKDMSDEELYSDEELVEVGKENIERIGKDIENNNESNLGTQKNFISENFFLSVEKNSRKNSRNSLYHEYHLGYEVDNNEGYKDIESATGVHVKQLPPDREPQLFDNKIGCMDGRYVGLYTSIPGGTACLMSTLLSLSENDALLQKHNLPHKIKQYLQDYFQSISMKYALVGHGDDNKKNDTYFDQQEDIGVKLIDCACGCGFIKYVSSSLTNDNTTLLNSAILRSTVQSPHSREMLGGEHRENNVIIVDGLYELQKDTSKSSFIIHLPSIHKLIEKHSQGLYEYILSQDKTIVIERKDIQNARKEQYLSKIRSVGDKLDLGSKKRWYISPQGHYLTMSPSKEHNFN